MSQKNTLKRIAFTFSVTFIILVLGLVPQAQSQVTPPDDDPECKCPVTDVHNDRCKKISESGDSDVQKKAKCKITQCVSTMAGLCSENDPSKTSPGKKYRCQWHTACKACELTNAQKNAGWFITEDCPDKDVCANHECNIARDTDGDGVSDETDSIQCEEE